MTLRAVPDAPDFDPPVEDRHPDVNLDAERAVLGAMLHSHDAITTVRLQLTAAAFYRPWHAELFDTILELEDAGHRCDVQLLVTHLRKARKLGTDGQISNAIFDLWAGCITAANVAYHARAVREAAKVRALQAEHTRMAQALDTVFRNGDTDALLDAAAQRSVALSLVADEPDTTAPIDGLHTWADFVERYRSDEQRWVVPGLLGRHDVVLILAAPGAGKSFLSRHVVTCLATGLHPFTLDRIKPVRTLLVDMENAPEQVAEETEPMLSQLTRTVGDMGDRGWVFTHMEGFNLRKRDDAALFERAIVETRPDVVAFGSLYNSYQRGSDGWDVAAADVQGVLKRLRARYDVTFWIEHHMGRASGGSGHTGTPYGGTDWEKWPTHGRVLRKASDRGDVYLLEAGTFRGDRGARPGFPLAVKRGGRHMFTAIFEEAELEQLIDASEGRRL